MTSDIAKPVALITGASSGFGNAIAKRLAKNYLLILVARRADLLNALAKDIGRDQCHVIACDINDHAAMEQHLRALDSRFKTIDVLINNAGLALGLEVAYKTNWLDWQQMIHTNCLALVWLTRFVLPAMVERNAGTIINLGSTAGTYAYKGANVYGSSKAFVEHFSACLRADLLGSKVRVCHLSPGLVGGTEFSNIRFHGDTDKAASVYEDVNPLLPEDIAETVHWVLGLPDRVNINHLEIMPVCQASAGLAVVKNA